MNVNSEIQLLHINAVALRKVTDEHQRRVDEISLKAAQPLSRVRQNKKRDRITGIALFYIKRKIK